MSLDAGVRGDVGASQREWRKTRRFLNENRTELTNAALQLYDAELRVESTPLLSHTEWVPALPLDLDDIQLEWTPDAVPAAVLGDERESEDVRPLGSPGWRFPTYSDALAALDRPGLFETARPTGWSAWTSPERLEWPSDMAGTSTSSTSRRRWRTSSLNGFARLVGPTGRTCPSALSLATRST